MTAAATCPMCGKPTERPYRPFCSRRCADIDLARWLNESYRIPDAPAGEADLSAEAAADQAPILHRNPHH